MSELQSIFLHDMDEARNLEIQFLGDNVFISIEWETEAGGMRAESFTLESEEAFRMANDILERLGGGTK